MRVISGIYKGKNLQGFDIDGTRPTMDRVKESLMAMIQSYIPDSVCLDLFAGSGSLGIEAISNGALECTFCDNNDIAIKTIKENTKMIKENIYINKTDYEYFLNNTNKKFDIIFLDPPYRLSLINKCLEIISKNNLLTDDGIIVLEYENENINPLNYEIFKEKKYGSKKVMILKK
ncbi:MAG: 16S rRNA (guanine(966)-N(2))-methyltransferase RsmD [Bacilli bacterium]|nr:16S rRNA (guanine(966)-N(2))-methyltransferase RsmD [Bacilli bacterium]